MKINELTVWLDYKLHIKHFNPKTVKVARSGGDDL